MLKYEEHTPKPFLLSEAITPGKFTISVKYIAWWGSKHRDFTVGMYSKHDLFIKDSSGNSNELHTDGSFPSEFGDRSSYCGMDNDCVKRQTECLTAYSNNPKKNCKTGLAFLISSSCSAKGAKSLLPLPHQACILGVLHAERACRMQT